MNDNNNIAIRVENLGKQYKIGIATETQDTLRDMLTEAVHRHAAPSG